MSTVSKPSQSAQPRKLAFGMLSAEGRPRLMLIVEEHVVDLQELLPAAPADIGGVIADWTALRERVEAAANDLELCGSPKRRRPDLATATSARQGFVRGQQLLGSRRGDGRTRRRGHRGVPISLHLSEASEHTRGFR